MKTIVLFGMGKYGKQFLKSRTYDIYREENVYFFDNNKALPCEIEGIKRLDALWNKTVDEIIITSGSWREIYRECVLHGSSPRIYDGVNDRICSYKQMCSDVDRKGGYISDSYIEFDDRIKLMRDEGVKDFLESGELFENIAEVAIMVSNLCNYASIHSQCPANTITSKEIMPMSVVYRILDELASIKFKGTICFHIYNEPLIDPRMGLFMKYSKEIMPECKIRLYSNGYYLNQCMLEDLHSLGMDALCVTGYGNNEYDRLMKLDVNVPYMVVYGNLDDRISYYNNTDKIVMVNKPCKTFFTQTTIYSNGDIGLCCLDYLHSYNIGNVYERSLKDCLNNDRVKSIQLRLLKGDRSEFTLCQNCRWSR